MRTIKTLTVTLAYCAILRLLTGCDLSNIPPSVSFKHNGIEYNNPDKNELEILASEGYRLEVTATDNKKVVSIYKRNGNIVELVDEDNSDKVFRGAFEGIAPADGNDEFYFVAVDNRGLESVLPVTIKAIPGHENQPPSLSFKYRGTTYTNDTTITAEAGETFTLEEIIGMDDEFVTVYKRNGTDVALQDSDASDERFEGEFSATAPLTGQVGYIFVARDDEGLEKTIRVTVNVEDTTPPGNPVNFRAVAGINEITLRWEEPNDTVGVTQYELKISPYNNIPNPSNPIDPSDVEDIAPPSPVAPGNTLEKNIAVDGGYYLSGYLRARDSAGNWSEWVNVGDILPESDVPPRISPEPWGAVGVSVANGELVDVRDKYENTIDKKISIATPYGALEFGKTTDGYYICTVPNRKPIYGNEFQHMITQIVCEAVSRGAAYDLNDGPIRVDLEPLASFSARRLVSMPKSLNWFLEQTREKRQMLLSQ